MDASRARPRSLLSSPQVAEKLPVFQAYCGEGEPRFANDVELELVPGGDGVFRWDDGEERHAMVEEVEPLRRFAFTWDDGHVAIELAEVDGGTRVLVTETAGAGWMAALSLRALALVPA